MADSSDEDIEKEPCSICKDIRKACKKLGDETFCSERIAKVKAKKMTIDELIDSLRERFGEEVFIKAIDEGKEAPEKESSTP
jgi:uncharacterized protein YpiB (UPF0302 family)